MIIRVPIISQKNLLQQRKIEHILLILKFSR